MFSAVFNPLSLVASLDPDVFYCTANGSGRLDVEMDGECLNVQPILDKGITVTLVSSYCARTLTCAVGAEGFAL